MNPNAKFERDLEQWLQTEAPASAPAGFHASVMDRARTLRQRPGWATSLPVRRLGRGRGMTLFAAAALVVGGALAGSGLLRLPTVVPPVPAPSFAVVATTSPDATSPGPSEPAAPSADPKPVAGPGGVWIRTETMGTPRYDPTAVRLQDGRVLVAGGLSGEVGYQQKLMSAELYDPDTGTWSATGSISKPFGNAATLLRDGKVLVLVDDVEGNPRGAEVYDPAKGTWTATGPMAPGKEKLDGTLTVLRDGRVLVAGSQGAQLYDPASGNWTATGPMVRPSWGLDTFTVLRDGRVLVVGGDGAQVYDPASGNWTATGKKNDQGFGAAAALLSDGKVLVAGGRVWTTVNDYHDLDSAEVYDPVTGSWTAIANLHAKDIRRAAFPQPDGKVLVVGSHSAEVYDPATGTWTALPVRPGIGNWYKDATLLSDGAVLVTGHLGDGNACTADLYDPSTGSWTTTATMLECGPRSLTPLLDGTVLLAGGSDCNDDGLCGSTGAAELYVPGGVSLPPLPAFPSPPPFVLPSPTPDPPLLPPAAGPVPPNARSWTVTVENKSSEPATMFVAENGEDGLRLVGSATPNVVPAGTTMKVTFLFPAKGPDDGWITVNPRQGEGADVGSVGADNIGMPGKIRITEECGGCWVGPPGP